MLQTAVSDGSLSVMLIQAIEADPILNSMKNLFEHNYATQGTTRLSRPDAAAAVMHWFLSRKGNELVAPVGAKSTTSAGSAQPTPIAIEDERPDFPSEVPETPDDAPEFPEDVAAPSTTSEGEGGSNNMRSRLLSVCAALNNDPSAFPTGSGTSTSAADDDEISLGDYQSANIILTPSEADAFKRRALPLLRQHLLLAGAKDAPETEDEFDAELSVGDEALLKDIELLGRGKPFESLDAKWEAEKQIFETRKAIMKQTTYIDPPMPEKMDVDEAAARLSRISAFCEGIIKKTLKE